MYFQKSNNIHKTKLNRAYKVMAFKLFSLVKVFMLRDQFKQHLLPGIKQGLCITRDLVTDSVTKQTQ
jgi:hypothetical protein